MKIAIIGFGLEGRAAYDYYKDGNEITICDQKVDLEVPTGVAHQLGDDYLRGLDVFDVIVRSPYVRPDAIVNANSADIIPKITSNTNEFMHACPTPNIIGITGTKGKGTTSTLVTKMLESAGFTVHLGGNIGLPALKLLEQNIQPDDWVVLELSSYQLIDLKQSPHLAACLLVVPEHLDWHESLEEYFAAKQQLFRQQTQDDIAVYYPASENSDAITKVTLAKRIPYMEEPGAHVENNLISIDGHDICRVDELQLPGEHNWQNVCAALTLAWQVTQDVPALRSAITSFTGLPYRIEKRREVHGIIYYNDSFATGPGASIAAMRAITQPKVMILGGYDRGLELHELATAIRDESTSLRHLLLIGASRERLASALREQGYDNFTLSDAGTMPEVVAAASALAQDGDAVVLSPAFASYDMFKNFEDRGNQFNQAVEAL